MPKSLAIAGLLLILLTMISCGVMMAHAEATRGLGAHDATEPVVEYTNPNTYLYGAIIDGTLLGEEKAFTNVRFQPSHTFQFYDISILFCGDQSEAFRHARGPIVVTYKSVAHRSYLGISCRDLVSVDKVVAIGAN